MPQLGPPAEHQRGQDPDDHAADGIRGQHQGARREAVAEGTADEHEHGTRDRRGHEHRAKHESRAGELDRQPGEGNEVELVAQDADGLTGEQEAEVPQAQWSKERRSGLGRAS